MYNMERTLIVVYKDEMLVNQLKKMVETKDSNKDGTFIDNTYGSINIVSWNEKVWLQNKKAGNIKGKVLFIGDIKGTDSLIPVIDVAFDDCGVIFGWAGNQAIVHADLKRLNNREEYLTFVEKLKVLPVPDMIKKPINIKSEETKDNEIDVTVTEIKIEKTKVNALMKKAKNAVSICKGKIEEFKDSAMEKKEDVLRNKNIRSKNAIKRQMLFYGIVNLYSEGLKKFMDM